jgi:hypothetical protein
MSVSTSLLERHAKVAILIDRLASSTFELCTYDFESHQHDHVNEWQEDLVTELKWLQRLLSTAITNEGDVRSMVGTGAGGPADAPRGPRPPQGH